MKNTRLVKITKIAVFAAMSAVCMIFFQFIIIPSAPFLKYDPSDVPALLISFALGPYSGLAVVLVKELVFAVSRFSAHDIIGLPMDFLASGSFVFISGLLYHKKKTKSGAVLALICGALAMTVIMALANYFIVPAYMKLFAPGVRIPQGGALLTMIAAAITPFNLIKGAINSAVTFLLYKKLSKVLH